MRLEQHSIALTILLLASALAFAETPEIPPFGPLSGRALAMGGRHFALADDIDTILANPAGLASAPRQLSVSRLQTRLTGPVFDIANAVVGGSDPTTALTDIIKNNDYKLNSGLSMAGPLSFGYVDGGIGFGLYNETKASLNAATISVVDLSVAEDVLLAGGYAFGFDLGRGNRLDIGVIGKGFVRGEVAVSKSIFEVQSLLSNPSSLMSSQPFAETTGIGLDLGLRWSLDKTLAAGIACRDAFSPALETKYPGVDGFLNSPAVNTSRYVIIAPNLGLGLMWKPPLGRLGQVIDSLLLVADYSDILDLFSPIPRNAILNVSLGVETKVLDILALRAGIRDALPSAGVGLDLGVFSVDLTAYGEELGNEPGMRPIYNLLLNFDFRY
ncbi:MAG TPA: hypothetical protein VFL04_00555 [Rectinemataceae bacterium]|nr:hypothetical protein [Rectinemataceae bacterium]